jgi:hypothetical protein
MRGGRQPDGRRAPRSNAMASPPPSRPRHHARRGGRRPPAGGWQRQRHEAIVVGTMTRRRIPTLLRIIIGGQQSTSRETSCVSYRRVSLRRVLMVFVQQIYFLRCFLRRPHTDRFPDDVPKKLRRNRNRDSCEKKGDRNGKNRNPEDSCRNMQPSLPISSLPTWFFGSCPSRFHRLLWGSFKIMVLLS